MKHCYCKTKPFEHQVQNGLAVTPSQMLEMTNRGIPISTQNLSVLADNTPCDGVPREYSRGIDLADLWNDKQDAVDKFRKINKKIKSGEIQSIE